MRPSVRLASLRVNVIRIEPDSDGTAVGTTRGVISVAAATIAAFGTVMNRRITKRRLGIAAATPNSDPPVVALHFGGPPCRTPHSHARPRWTVAAAAAAAIDS